MGLVGEPSGSYELLPLLPIWQLLYHLFGRKPTQGEANKTVAGNERFELGAGEGRAPFLFGAGGGGLIELSRRLRWALSEAKGTIISPCSGQPVWGVGKQVPRDVLRPHSLPCRALLSPHWSRFGAEPGGL